MSPPIIIVGGGIAGLATALSFHARGQSAVVLERRDAPSLEGAGIQIGPNGVVALRQLGIDEAVRHHASVPEAIRVHDGVSGRELTRMPLGAWMAARHGAPYWVVRRADLLRALAEAAAARGVDVRYGTAPMATAADIVPSMPAVALADGTRLEGRALIGADGVWSTVRRWHFRGADAAYCGRAAARAVVDADRVDIARTAVSVWMAPNAHVVAYPIAAGRQFNIVVITPEANASVETWAHPVTPEDMARRSQRFAPSVRRLVDRADGWRQWPLMTLAPLKTYMSGRVALVGDAAHPMLPFLAQGAVMALEDAVVLGACFEAHRRDTERALQTYCDERLARTQSVVAAAAQQGRIFHLDGAMRAARDLSLRLTPPSLMMRRYDWLYGGARAAT